MPSTEQKCKIKSQVGDAAARVVILKTDCSWTPEQTHSELDVQTSQFLFCFETA